MTTPKGGRPKTRRGQVRDVLTTVRHILTDMRDIWDSRYAPEVEPERSPEAWKTLHYNASRLEAFGAVLAEFAEKRYTELTGKEMPYDKFAK